MFTRSGGDLEIEDDKHTFQAMVIEALGSFFYITVFLINTEPSSRFFEERSLNLLAIAAAYGCAITFSTKLAGGSMNPAYGFSVNFTMLMDTGEGKTLKWIWLYLTMPFVGTVFALIFHEFIFKKTQEGIDKIERRQSEYEPPPAVNDLDQD